MEYANRVIENLNKVLMSMPKRSTKLEYVSVERLGISMQMTTEGYQDYLTWPEEKKDNIFKTVIEAMNEPSNPIPVTYRYDGLDFDSKEELLEWKAREEYNTINA